MVGVIGPRWGSDVTSELGRALPRSPRHLRLSHSSRRVLSTPPNGLVPRHPTLASPCLRCSEETILWHIGGDSTPVKKRKGNRSVIDCDGALTTLLLRCQDDGVPEGRGQNPSAGSGRDVPTMGWCLYRVRTCACARPCGACHSQFPTADTSGHGTQ